MLFYFNLPLPSESKEIMSYFFLQIFDINLTS